MEHLELTSLVIINILSNIWYSVLVPFLPIEFKKYKIHVSVYGYIFAVYALAVIIGSPIVGKSLTTCGRKFILILGMFWMGVSLLGFGSIGFLPRNLIVPAALVLRTSQGLSSGLIQTTSYAIVSILYPDGQQKYLGILEASMGLGLVVGPVIGSILYTFVEFQGTFYSIGCIFLISVVILIWAIPQTVNKTDDKKTDFPSDQLEEVTPKKNGETKAQEDIAIKYSEVLKQRIFVCSSVAAFFGYFGYSFMEPVLAIRLMDFELSEFWIGAFFCINAVGYVLGSLTVSFLSERFNNKILIWFGMIIAGCFEFLIGPSVLLPNELWIMAIGQFFLGVFTIYFQVTSLPEMINDVVRTHPNQKYEASDISSGVFNAMLGLGQMVSPLYGSYMTDYFGFRLWADGVGVLMIAYAMIYFWLWVGLTYFKEGAETLKAIPPIQRLSARESIIEAMGTRSAKKNRSYANRDPNNGLFKKFTKSDE